jgi:signal recognition particle receptor subunit beta
MVSESSRSDPNYLATTVTQSVKVLVLGPFAVGKTTLIESVSEIDPLRTEENMTTASVGVDSLTGVADKVTTTVALDFGRRTLDDVCLYLFGTPGQRRFWDFWQGLAIGALGALVLVDTRRIEDTFEVLDQIEEQLSDLPFALALNQFPDAPAYSPEKLRAALDLLPETPIVTCNALDPSSCVEALVTLVEHALDTSSSPKALA